MVVGDLHLFESLHGVRSHSSIVHEVVEAIGEQTGDFLGSGLNRGWLANVEVDKMEASVAVFGLELLKAGSRSGVSRGGDDGVLPVIKLLNKASAVVLLERTEKNMSTDQLGGEL